jgi:Fe-S-cluster containining protein
VPDNLITSLELIRQYSQRKEAENFRFRTHVKFKINLTDEELDAVVRKTTDEVWAQIDCTACAHCCKTLYPILDREDIDRLAQRFGVTAKKFGQEFLMRGDGGEWAMKCAPCPFLKDNKCSVYQDRPKACRDFPYLHSSGFRQRMLGAIENAASCPIVYNTMEQLKRRLGFRKRR